MPNCSGLWIITTAEGADDNVAIRLPGHDLPNCWIDNRRHGITIDDSVQFQNSGAVRSQAS